MVTTYRIRLSQEITADVTGDYYPGFAGTYYEPPKPESVTLIDVVIDGQGVINGLTDEQLERIEAAWLRAVHDQRDAKDEEPRYFSAQAPDTWKR